MLVPRLSCEQSLLVLYPCPLYHLLLALPSAFSFSSDNFSSQVAQVVEILIPYRSGFKMFYKATTLLAASLPLIQAGPSFVPGFSITWSDDFTGSAGSLPSASNWIIDTGTSYPGGPAQWGTGEVQTYTNNPQNVKLTGNGQLQITPIRDSNGRWTSGRIETTRTDFQAKAGGKMRISARISLPDVTGAAAAGYWPAFWTLGNNFRGNYWNWPVSLFTHILPIFDVMLRIGTVSRRVRHHGERERYQPWLGSAPLRHQPRRRLQRSQWHWQQWRMPQLQLPGQLSRLLFRSEPRSVS